MPFQASSFRSSSELRFVSHLLFLSRRNSSALLSNRSRQDRSSLHSSSLYGLLTGEHWRVRIPRVPWGRMGRRQARMALGLRTLLFTKSHHDRTQGSSRTRRLAAIRTLNLSSLQRPPFSSAFILGTAPTTPSFMVGQTSVRPNRFLLCRRFMHAFPSDFYHLVSFSSLL